MQLQYASKKRFQFGCFSAFQSIVPLRSAFCSVLFRLFRSVAVAFHFVLLQVLQLLQAVHSLLAQRFILIQAARALFTQRSAHIATTFTVRHVAAATILSGSFRFILIQAAYATFHWLTQ